MLQNILKIIITGTYLTIYFSSGNHKNGHLGSGTGQTRI